MFARKYDKQVDAVVEVLGSFMKGTIVPWPVIEQAMGRHREEKGGRTIIGRVRKQLRRDRQINSLPDTNVGLRLLTDAQSAIEIPALRQKKARRQISRGLRETEIIDTSQLTNHASISLAISRKHMKAERLALSRAKREVESLTKTTRSVISQN